MIVAARFDTETEAAKMRISNGDVVAAILVTQVNGTACTSRKRKTSFRKYEL